MNTNNGNSNNDNNDNNNMTSLPMFMGSFLINQQLQHKDHKIGFFV